jgi:cytochrome P450
MSVTLREGWLLPNARAMAADAPGFLLEQSRRHGPLFRITAGPMTLTAVGDPTLIQQVLQKNAKAYGRGAAYDFLRPLLGDGLPVTDPPLWLYRRRTMQPAFHKRNMVDWVGAIRDTAEKHLNRLVDGTTVNTRDIMMSLAREIIVRVLLSDSLGAEADRVQEAFQFVDNYVGETGLSPIRIPLWLPTPLHRKYHRSIELIRSQLQRVIDERRRSATPPNDLLTMLLRAKDPETGQSLTDLEVRNEVVTLFIAGHGTTANLLMWTVKLLTEHPDVRKQLQAEVDAVIERPIDGETIERLSLVHAVVRESMRIFPPVWLIAREVFEPDRLGDIDLKPKERLLLLPWVIHRRPDLWEQPEAFRPERFLTERSIDAAVWKYTYLPFGAGPHVCIGNHFAVLEAVTILAMLLKRGHLEALQPDAAKPTMTLALTSADGLPARFVARSTYRPS